MCRHTQCESVDACPCPDPEDNFESVSPKGLVLTCPSPLLYSQ